MGFLLCAALPARADITLSRPLPSSPGLTTTGIMYAFIPGVVRGQSWAEMQLEQIRFGAGNGFLEGPEGEAAYILAALHGTPLDALVMELTEGPAAFDIPKLLNRALFPEQQLQSAFAAVGLQVDNLMPRREIPVYVIDAAQAFFRVYNRVLTQALVIRSWFRDPVERSDGPAPEVDAEFSFQEMEKPVVFHKKPKKRPSSSEPKPTLIGKIVPRSMWKIFLGICLGLFIWRFVQKRDSIL